MSEANRLLGDSNLISFVSTAKPDDARAFYVDVLGLDFVRDEPMAMVFRGGGRYLRMQKVETMPPSTGSVLGWEVDDIEGTVRALGDRGVAVERYDGMPQDELGIARFPNGDRVAWFLDPDGNILSLSELVPPA